VLGPTAASSRRSANAAAPRPGAQIQARISRKKRRRVVGYPTGSRNVEDLLKDAEPAIASMPDPAKTRNLLRLDRRLLELYAVRGRAISFYANRKAEFGLK
jgi:hypothetical protein